MQTLRVFLIVFGLVGLACGDDDSPEMDAGSDAATMDAMASGEWVALVRGTLFTDDLVMAQMRHDGLAAGGEEIARMAGDFGHDAMLGTTLLGTTENAFLGVDRWTSFDGMNNFYANPDFATGFAMLFEGDPNLEFFVRSDFHEWGELTAGDGADHVFVVVRGTLADADPASARASHDLVAQGGEEMVRAAGDLAHVVYVGVEDPREFLAFDIWQDTTNLEAVYTDPDFQAAFGALFAEPPTIAVYGSTDWHQW